MTKIHARNLAPVPEDAMIDAVAEFATWLATWEEDGSIRCRYREIIEDYLVWRARDRSPMGSARTRFVTGRSRTVPAHHVGAALRLWDEHQALVGHTLPLDR